MNNAIKMLYDEHNIIVNSLDVVNWASSLIGKDDEEYERTIHQLIKFFRLYADQFHHHKEEEILFPEMDKKNELLGGGMLKEMLDNHEDFREHILNIEKSLNNRKYSEAQAELEKYVESLLDHIAVENDEVFQIAETLFTDDELDKINHRFQDCDRELGDKLKEELEDLIGSLRNKIVLK